jgi:hypothetical protein
LGTPCNAASSAALNASLQSIVATARAAVESQLLALAVSDRVNCEELVLCLLPWHLAWDLTALTDRPLPTENVVVCNSKFLRESLGPSLARLLDSLAPVKP